MGDIRVSGFGTGNVVVTKLEDVRTRPFPVSESFVATCDRSVLGDYAVPERLLVLSDVLMRAIVIHGVKAMSMADISYPLSDMSAEYGLSTRVPRVELLYWWSQSDDEVLRESARRQYTGDAELTEEMGRVALFASAPSMTYHEFYFAGIENNEFIGYCIANDLDVVMALSLQNSKAVA